MNNYVDILYQNKLKNIKILNKFDDFIKICKENFHISNKKIKLIARFKNENLNYEISNQDEYFKCLYNKEFNEFEILDFNSLFIKNKNINSDKTQKEIDDLKNEIKNLKSENLYLNNEIKNFMKILVIIIIILIMKIIVIIIMKIIVIIIIMKLIIIKIVIMKIIIIMKMNVVIMLTVIKLLIKI